ncbi:DUF4917 family protein [Mangrovivirga cuniculi]|uniref:DUF4917 family protein n=1 Tax=Mangrovivirga cuniculi TaxID=2715131 RepID=UPI001C2FDE54|nr:DUF4917 family protein [Mangrovivirga cuniculi]
MFTAEELNNEGIREWRNIESFFTDCPILLGNGFSLNFSETLRYKFLHQNFIENCSDVAKELFQSFGTQNFELILRNLEITERVHTALEINEPRIIEFRNEVRQGLIESIRRIHPTPASIDYENLREFSEQLRPFTNIYTTNYDLYLYYLILDTRKFGDYFLGIMMFSLINSEDRMR